MRYFKILVFFITTLVTFSCARQYTIEKYPKLKISYGYYQEYVSGIRGGGGGYNITLMLDKKANLSEQEIKVVGIYFDNSYGLLKKQTDRKYQTYINSNKNSEGNLLGNEDLVNEDEVIINKIPFELKKNEAVVSYEQKGTVKHMKISLLEEKSNDRPM